MFADKRLQVHATERQLLCAMKIIGHKELNHSEEAKYLPFKIDLAWSIFVPKTLVKGDIMLHLIKPARIAAIRDRIHRI